MPGGTTLPRGTRCPAHSSAKRRGQRYRSGTTNARGRVRSAMWDRSLRGLASTSVPAVARRGGWCGYRQDCPRCGCRLAGYSRVRIPCFRMMSPRLCMFHRCGFSRPLPGVGATAAGGVGRGRRPSAAVGWFVDGRSPAAPIGPAPRDGRPGRRGPPRSVADRVKISPARGRREAPVR